jgi:hypothetical protein
MTLYCTHHQTARLRVNGSFSHVVQVRGTQVAGHNNNCVLEVDDPSLAVRKPAVIKNLEKERDEFPACFLYPVFRKSVTM